MHANELRTLRVQPKRSLSQHFLIDQNIIQKTLDQAAVQPGDHVLEIGPGLGAITEQLVKRGARVTAVELDARFAQRLKDRWNIRVICADALSFQLGAIDYPTKIVANLPYHIATPLICRLIQHAKIFTTMTLFIQKEVGMRICAQPKGYGYSHLSLFVQAYSKPCRCFDVSPHCFFPMPKVRSSVIHLKLAPFPFTLDPKALFEMTRTSFNQKRKMLRSSLRGFADPRRIQQALDEIGYLPTARPGELDLAAFASLFEKIGPHQKRHTNAHEHTIPPAALS